MENHPNGSQFTDYADLPDEESLRLSSAPYDIAHSPGSTSPANQAISQEFDHHDVGSFLMGDVQMLIRDGYQSDGSSTRHSSENLGAYLDEDHACMSSGESSRSSISSIPPSVFANMAEGVKAPGHRHSHPWDSHDGIHAHGRIDATLRPLSATRLREAAFRKPSSVKAMQMHTEDERDDDAFLTPPKRRAAHQRYSDASMRSVGSSPLRKSQFYSPTGSAASKQKAKDEYPLVLLHCNLLPPSLPVPGAAAFHNQKIVREVLPPVFWRRWKLLEEKVGSGVLRERGVLISHPEDLYDLLEERLLESLELQRPRFDHGHFIGHDEAESEKEDRLEKEDSATDEEEGEACPDCGGHVVRHGNAGRKWEIKVFAANGLMRAGAWAAAWKEMEKVDVEVGLWLPSEIRRELEKRLMGDDYYCCQLDPQLQVPQLQVPGNDPVIPTHPKARHARTSSSITADQRSFSFDGTETQSPPAINNPASVESRPPKPSFSPQLNDDIDIQTLLVNYVRVLASDRRNVAIAILSILMVFFAIQSGSQVKPSALRPFPHDFMEHEPLHPPVTSVSQADSTIRNVPIACVSQAAESANSEIIVETAPLSVSSIPDPASMSVLPPAISETVAEPVLVSARDISEPVGESVQSTVSSEAVAKITPTRVGDISESVSMSSQAVALSEAITQVAMSEPDRSHHESDASSRAKSLLTHSQAQQQLPESLYPVVEPSTRRIALIKEMTPAPDSLSPITEQLMGKQMI
ncbi:uncharacterized protein BO95DRAFT_193745 [Aspergillus brunneoviolaceus CBS 621.78]|uniref:Uncharacterized protein n=1 Tax=Aspergillus brunneoviolaceus CBS 621.78 TaxID=1450534 RepID=A0ACD1GLR2_9EURO|nr:hypothetical protein BO95DRAFT_193745 [Aspergillus brunneoviolaceus CBS 621.78]RAH50187.1 hypothetical protein BO95DRAFT_193745 [Aspergillus brunneoviolaceus CBS 621.78]